MCVKIHVILFKNWKLLCEIVYQHPLYFQKMHAKKDKKFCQKVKKKRGESIGKRETLLSKTSAGRKSYTFP